jgi:organic radical activating enzyme
MQLTHSEIDGLRRTRGRSMLLFITDRCPVGCAHCSVDSRADSPMITDFDLFEQIVDWLAGLPQIEVVGISGGEPFVERRGLTLATRRLAAAGKGLVVFTSGIWAAPVKVPSWVCEILDSCASVYLSTDAFHGQAIDDDCLIRAARTIAESGAWIVLQVLDRGAARDQAVDRLTRAFGARWDQHAEINLVTPLLNGRGAEVFTRLVRAEGRAFGPCSLVRSPMIRYDGQVSGCCNESVIMGVGPSRLRRRARSGAEIGAVVEQFHTDSLLRVIGDVGLGVLTEHPRFEELANQRFSTNCELCWKVLERMPEGSDRLVDAIAALELENR